MNAVKNAVLSALRKKERQFSKIDELKSINVVSEIINLRVKAQKIIDENNGNHEKIAQLIRPLGIEERRLKDVLKRQSNINLFKKECKLAIEISELKSELSRLNFYGVSK